MFHFPRGIDRKGFSEKELFNDARYTQVSHPLSICQKKALVWHEAPLDPF